ncbi:hypothetical protein ABZX78_30985 [Streptomyces cellulosae]
MSSAIAPAERPVILRSLMIAIAARDAFVGHTAMVDDQDCTVSPGVRLRTPAEVVDHLGSRGRTGIVDAIEIPPPGARTGTGSSPAGASRTPPRPWVLTDGDGRVLFCSPTKPGSCADITHARR